MAEKGHISLLELQGLIKSRLDEAFPLTYWVAAEISELKVNYSGHCYLELVEKGGDNQVPRAKCSAVVWRSTYGALLGHFASTTGSELKVGLKVLLRVSVIYHELYGLSLQVSDIDPLYTLGEMEQQRQMTIKQLQQDGVYDMNRELGLPDVVQRIAVVSSRNAAGYQDFMQEIERCGYRFEIMLFDAFMQGNAAEESIVEALERVSDSSESFDAVVVIRGGGSQSDLACFNSYRLCSHIAQFPLPVITGIGHDKDVSVADLIAALSLKTPTAVAAYLVNGLAEFEGYLEALQSNIVEFAVGIIDFQKRELQKNSFLLSKVATELTRSMELRLERLAGELVRRSENSILARSNRLDTLWASLTERVNRTVAAQRHILELFDTLAASRRPEKILALGFAIVRIGSVAIKSSEDLSLGQNIEITLSKGRAEARIEKIYGK